MIILSSQLFALLRNTLRHCHVTSSTTVSLAVTPTARGCPLTNRHLPSVHYGVGWLKKGDPEGSSRDGVAVTV